MLQRLIICQALIFHSRKKAQHQLCSAPDYLNLGYPNRLLFPLYRNLLLIYIYLCNVFIYFVTIFFICIHYFITNFFIFSTIFCIFYLHFKCADTKISLDLIILFIFYLLFPSVLDIFVSYLNLLKCVIQLFKKIKSI